MHQEQRQNDRLTDLETDTARIEQTTTDLEDIQHTQIELTELKDRRVGNQFENLIHKLHNLSNLYMGMEEKLNELAEFTSLIKDDIDDLRKSIESLSDRSDPNSDPTV